jgi:hypothetical protein
MMGRGVGFLLALFLIVFAGEAKAWTPFGTVEHTTRIEDVTLTTPDGDPLFLGYKTSTLYFLLGVYVSDDGYVLGLRASPRHIAEMPPPNVLIELQKQGKLPNPLPAYHLGLGDYAAGFSLWLVVLPIVAAYLYYHFAFGPGRRRRRRRTAEY